MRKIILGTILTSVVLTLSIGDAEARKRSKRTRTVDVVDVVRKPAKTTTVFDSESWQPPVTLPGLVSAYQAYAASQYTFEGKDNLFPTVVYLNKQELTEVKKPIISPFSGVVWATFGAVCAACTGLGLLALYVNKDLVRLT